MQACFAARVAAVMSQQRHASTGAAHALFPFPQPQRHGPQLPQPEGLVLAAATQLRALLPFTYEISAQRHRSVEQRGLVVQYLPQQQDPLAGTPARRPSARAPAESHLQITYPFSSNAALREQYERFTTGNVRTGLILEDLDAFAGDIAARHTGPLPPGASIVTAAVDRLTWLIPNTVDEAPAAPSGDSAAPAAVRDALLGAAPWGGALPLSRDLRMAGQVTWVGTTSLEVRIELHCLRGGAWEYVGSVLFVMVATRSRSTGEAAAVPSLEPGSAAERALEQQGASRQGARRERRAAGTPALVPTAAEVTLLHSLARELDARRGGPLAWATFASQSGGAGAGAVPPTTLSATRLMHSQDQNTSGSTFGGHVLREAFEGAFAVTALHAGGFCECVGMDEVTFLHPVPTGSILQLHAKVAYVAGPLVYVAVRAECHNPGSSEMLITNELTFVFVAREGAPPPPPVAPVTLSDGLQFLAAYRKHHAVGADSAAAASHL